MKLNEKNEMTS